MITDQGRPLITVMIQHKSDGCSFLKFGRFKKIEEDKLIIKAFY
jgi:hypothetical protein